MSVNEAVLMEAGAQLAGGISCRIINSLRKLSIWNRKVRIFLWSLSLVFTDCVYSKIKAYCFIYHVYFPNCRVYGATRYVFAMAILSVSVSVTFVYWHDQTFFHHLAIVPSLFGENIGPTAYITYEATSIKRHELYTVVFPIEGLFKVICGQRDARERSRDLSNNDTRK